MHRPSPHPSVSPARAWTAVRCAGSTHTHTLWGGSWHITEPPWPRTQPGMKAGGRASGGLAPGDTQQQDLAQGQAIGQWPPCPGGPPKRSRRGPSAAPPRVGRECRLLTQPQLAPWPRSTPSGLQGHMLRWRQAGFGACMMLGPSLASHASTPKSRGETKGDTGREGGWEEPPAPPPQRWR